MAIILAEESQISSLIQDAVQKALIEFFLDKEPEAKPKRFLNVQEASELLNLSINTIYGLTSSGKLPHLKRSRKLIFDREVLTEWLLSRN